MSETILEVKNIRKSFGRVEVLKGIDFSLNRGEVLVIIGSSGSGKTTLLRCLNFLEEPNEGEIAVERREFIYYRAFLATSTSEAKAAASWIAISESIFLFSVIPAFFRPFMNVE